MKKLTWMERDDERRRRRTTTTTATATAAAGGCGGGRGGGIHTRVHKRCFVIVTRRAAAAPLGFINLVLEPATRPRRRATDRPKKDEGRVPPGCLPACLLPRRAGARAREFLRASWIFSSAFFIVESRADESARAREFLNEPAATG